MHLIKIVLEEIFIDILENIERLTHTNEKNNLGINSNNIDINIEFIFQIK